MSHAEREADRIEAAEVHANAVQEENDRLHRLVDEWRQGDGHQVCRDELARAEVVVYHARAFRQAIAKWDTVRDANTPVGALIAAVDVYGIEPAEAARAALNMRVRDATEAAVREIKWLHHTTPAALDLVAAWDERRALPETPPELVRPAYPHGEHQPDVLAEIAAERARQDAKWGEQNHPDGTDSGAFFRERANTRRQWVQDFAAVGKLTWRHILDEEVHEAYCETDHDKLRAELIQIAAVAVAWVEAIDRRALTGEQTEGA